MSEFITLWQQCGKGQVTLRATAIDSIISRVKYSDDGYEDGFEGAEVSMHNGCTFIVVESAKTVSARLGVDP